MHKASEFQNYNRQPHCTLLGGYGDLSVTKLQICSLPCHITQSKCPPQGMKLLLVYMKTLFLFFPFPLLLMFSFPSFGFSRKAQLQT